MPDNTETINCVLCQSQNHRVICSKFSLNLVKCKNCHLVYTNPRLIEKELLRRYGDEYFYNECLPIFNANSTRFDLETVNKHYSLYVNLLNPFHKPGKKLLDLGCGPGFFLKSAEQAGWTAEGVEISPIATDYANKVVKVKVQNSSLEKVHFPEENFDVITLLDVIEHLRDPLQTLREIHRILKQDGVLLLNTPDLNSLSRFFLGKDWAVLSPAEHLFNFSQKTLELLLEKANFQIVCIQNLFHFNPDYTHDIPGWRHTLWKAVCSRLESRHLAAKTRSFEASTLNSRLVFQKDEVSPLKLTSKLKIGVYRWIKKWFKGDTIIVVAVKSPR
jgi:2-polyprenyl-3-methyl-5-hydroxy-6-metoxy-1,4-benzoquinol methylase